MLRAVSHMMAKVLFCVSLIAPPVVVAQQKPNILLLMAEDMGPRVGAFGDAVAVTPNLDRLAAQGVRYTNVFGAAGVCATNRAATIMGMHQESFGAQHMRSTMHAPADYQPVPPGQAKAFPELLRAGGYFTFTTRKLDYQFSGPMPDSGPFTIWDREGFSNSWESPPMQPFFGYMNFASTHESAIFERWTWPQSIVHALAQASHIYGHRNTEDQVFPEEVEVPPYYPDTTPIRTDIARHYNNIITMDREVGKVLSELEQAGLAENTIVIWTTDHGDGLPRAKRELYDSGLHTPMIVRWPDKWRPDGVAPGSVDDRLISFVDFAPTLLSLAGVPIPRYIQGRSFAGPAERPARQYVFAARDRIDEVPDQQRAVRDRRFKYIRNYNQQPGGFHIAFRDIARGMQELWRALEMGELNDVQRQWFEPRPPEYLFDTETDPHEINNLADDPAYAEVLYRMRDALARHQARINDYGEMNETDMAELFWPGGRQPQTLPVEFNLLADGRLVLSSATEGASIGYRQGDSSWQLYSSPLAAPEGVLEAKAVRYGWKESSETEYQP